MALAGGASIVVASRDEVLSPGRLTELVRAEAITHAFVTPTILSLVEPGDCPRLREVLTAGETLPVELARRWSAPHRRVTNGYGPTEITVACTSFDTTGWDGPQPLPVGTPMPNRQIYVLEPSGELAPVGVPGEIVELRGLRIELEEIEGLLGRHPAIAQVAAAVRRDPAGLEVLVAYLVPATGAAEVEAGTLRSFLVAELPAAMVPSIFAYVDAIPLTSTGKVNRRALPDPFVAVSGGRSGYVPARTAAEQRVADAFASVLTVARVGAEDSFFELGGHSLQASYVLARLAQTTGVSVPLKDFYADPRVSSVARLLTSAVATGERSPLVTLKDVNGRPGLYCPHAVSGSPYWYRGLGRALPPDQPLYSFEAPGIEGEQIPIDDMRELAARYVAAMRQHQPAGPYLLAGWSMGGFVAFEMARQLAAAAMPALLVLIDSNEPGPFPPPSEHEMMQTFVHDLCGLNGRAPLAVDETVGALDHNGRLAHLREILVAAQLFPSDVAPDFLANRYAVFRANLLAGYNYQPQPYPGRLVLFQAAQEESRSAWRAYASGGFEEVVLPGTHYTMWTEENLPLLASALAERVAAALGRPRG